MSRRQFLLFSLLSAAGIVVGADVLWSLSEQERKRLETMAKERLKASQKSSGKTITPTTLEDEVVERFLSTSEGHKDWVREAIKNPDINSIGIDVLEHIDVSGPAVEDAVEGIPNVEMNPDRFSYIQMGETLRVLLDASKSRLYENYGEDHTSEDVERMSGHYALVAGSAIYSNFISLREFGFDRYDEEWRNSKGREIGPASERWFYKSGWGTRCFPSLFPGTQDRDFEIQGKDRAMHFMNHMFVTYELLHSKKYETSERLEAPVGLQQLLHYGADVAPELAIGLADTGIGYMYELMGSLKEQNFPGYKYTNSKGETKIVKREDIQEGLLDVEVAHDLEANRLGVLCGIAWFNGNYNTVIDVMNDPRLREVTDNPQIPQDLIDRLAA